MKNRKLDPTRLSKLRTLLRQEKLDGLLVPRSDEFLGEYVPASAERLRWISNFSGSWGSTVIGLRSAALIVDGRYTIQAAKEAPDFELLSPENAALTSFVSKKFQKSARIGFDPWTLSIVEAKRIRNVLVKTGIDLVSTKANLIDRIWHDRPSPPAHPIVEHLLKFSGQSRSDKLKSLAKQLQEKNCEATLLTDPHSVAWLLNIRGSDVDHTPLPLVRAIVDSKGTATVFVEKSRVDSDLQKSFGRVVKLENPDRFTNHLIELAVSKSRVLIDAGQCPDIIRTIFDKDKGTLIEGQDLCVLPRARKNKIEQQGALAAQLRDGAALSNFLHWLNDAAAKGGLTEKAAEQKLLKFRIATGKLKDVSFRTIAASGPNAALPHYHAMGKNGRTIRSNEIFLIDSGGQYLDGTTDVTRTVIVGKPTASMKRHFTLVLKGMIAVSQARFPAGTTGVQLDTLARAALWEHGFDFDHGTGHGVGSYLSVHEGPARISKAGHVALEPGMILSNEPGYYLKGKYGIRIENLLLVAPPKKPKSGDREMLSFETLTYAPIDRNLIDDTIMTRSEIQWLDQYHADVWGKLASKVAKETRKWLEFACAPLMRKT